MVALVTVDDLQRHLQQDVPADLVPSAQAALGYAQACVQAYCRRTFAGTEPNVEAVTGVMLSVAARLFVDPVQRSTYSGPGPDGYNYTPASPGQILTAQELATLAHFRRVIVPTSVSSSAGLP